MRNLITMTALVLGVASSTAVAQTDQIGSLGSDSHLDSAYDYELYIALPDTAKGWFIEYVYADGSKRIRGPFKSERDAVIEAERDEIHLGHLRDGELPVEEYIYEGLAEPNWQYFETYATRAEAEADAAYFEEIGMLTDIRRVSLLRRSTRLIKPIRLE